MKREQLVEIAQGITKFALAYGSLPKDLFLAALSGHALLPEGTRLRGDQARRLIEAFPKICLNNSPRAKIWRDVQLDPHSMDFEVLREAVESDLKTPKRASRYLIPPLVRAQTQISGFLAMKAAKLEAIVASFRSQEQQVREIVKLLEPFLTVTADRQVESSLSLKILSERVVIGQAVPIQAYFTRSGKTYNVTKKTDFDVQPAFRAELRGAEVVTHAPGQVRIRGSYNGESAIVDLFVTPGAGHSSAAETQTPSPPASSPKSPEDLEPTAIVSLPLKSDAEVSNQVQDSMHTIALTAESQSRFHALTSQRNDGDDSQESLLAESNDEFCSAQTIVSTSENLSESEDAIATIQVSANDDPRHRNQAVPEGFAIQTTQVMPPENDSSIMQSGATARFVPAPLVISIVTMLEPQTPVDQILVDGQKSWSHFGTSLSHILLQPGLRMIDINYSGRGKLLAHSRLAIEWRLPEVSQEDFGELLGDAPPLCLELFCQLSNRGRETAKLRILTLSDYVAMTQSESRKQVSLKPRSEDCYYADFELQNQQLVLQIHGRCGEHTLNFNYQHSLAAQ